MTTDAEREIAWMCLGQTRGAEGEVRKQDAQLLAMHKNVDDTRALHVIYPAHGGLEVRAEVHVSAVIDVDAATVDLVAMGGVGLHRG